MWWNYTQLWKPHHCNCHCEKPRWQSLQQCSKALRENSSRLHAWHSFLLIPYIVLSTQLTLLFLDAIVCLSIHSHICRGLPDNTSHNCSDAPLLAYHHAALFLNISAQFLSGWHHVCLTSSLVAISFHIFHLLSSIHASSETLYLLPKGVISARCQSREKFPGLHQQLPFELKRERLEGLNYAQSHNHLHEGWSYVGLTDVLHGVHVFYLHVLISAETRKACSLTVANISTPGVNKNIINSYCFVFNYIPIFSLILKDDYGPRQRHP